MTRATRAVVLAVVLALAAPACGGDDAATPALPAEGVPAAWCDLYRTVQARGAALAATVPDQAGVDELRGLLDELEATAPAPVQADVRTAGLVMRQLLDAVVASGFSPAVLADPTAFITEADRVAGEAAGARLESFVDDGCSVTG